MVKIGLKIFIAGYVFWYGLGYLNPNVIGLLNLFDVNLAIILFFGFTILGYKFGYNSIPKYIPSEVKLHEYGVGNRSFVLLVMVFILVAIFLYLTSGKGMLGYHAVRAQIAIGILIFIYTCLFRGWKKVIFLLFFFAIMLFSLETYSRRPFLTLSATILLIPLIRNRYSLQKTTFIGISTAIFGVVILSYITGIRYLGETVYLFEIGSLLREGISVFISGEGFDTVYLTSYVIENYKTSDYLHGQTFFGGFTNFIPRVFWPEKPIAFGVTLSSQYFDVGLDELFTNLGPGIVAEAYANGGFISVTVVAILFGLVIGCTDRAIENNCYNWIYLLLGVVFYPVIFFVIRGDFLNSFYEFYSKAGVIGVIIFSLGLHHHLINRFQNDDM